MRSVDRNVVMRRMTVLNVYRLTPKSDHRSLLYVGVCCYAAAMFDVSQ